MCRVLLLLVECCLLFVGGCALRVVCWLSFVVRCSLCLALVLFVVVCFLLMVDVSLLMFGVRCV